MANLLSHYRVFRNISRLDDRLFRVSKEQYQAADYEKYDQREDRGAIRIRKLSDEAEYDWADP